MDKRNIIRYPCENIKFIPLNDCNSSSQGTCLIVAVSLNDICENEHLLVVVEVYKNNNFYARQVRKVFTGCNDKNYGYSCNNDNCCLPCNMVDNFFVDEFEFYFLGDCNPKCISVKVKTQYICDC